MSSISAALRTHYLAEIAAFESEPQRQILALMERTPALVEYAERYPQFSSFASRMLFAAHPDVFAARQIDKWSLPPPGGESYASVQLRMRDWVDGLTGDTVAVAHGGTARALMVALGVRSVAEAAELMIEQGTVYVFNGSRLDKYS